MTSPIRWIVVADQRTARLLTLQFVPGGRWHCEEKDTLESRWEDYHDRGRPSALDARPSASSHAHFGPGANEARMEEERRRFARDVASWLDHDCPLPPEQVVTVFAAPGFFGVLREVAKACTQPADLHELELTRMRPEEIAGHPGVHRALGIEPRSASVA